MRRIYLLLFVIFIAGTFLRFYQLSNFPVGFFRDEVSLGYNAYSILLTGKDITGHFLPLHLESFLYSPAGYSYFSIPFVFLFGLSEFSIRFASALFGSLTILTIFFLTKALFPDYKRKDFLSIIAALFLAVNPWHINLSRASTENVLVVFFITLGIYLYLIWLKKNNLYFFILSFVCFGLTLLIYQAPRAFLPLFLPLLFVTFLKKNKKKWIMSIAVFVVLIFLPVLFILKSPTLSTRVRMLSIFQQPGTQDVLNEQLMEDGVAKQNSLVSRLYNNKLIDYSSVFTSNYFKHLSYDFLFTENTYPIRYKIPSMGLLYSFDILLLTIGIWWILFKERKLGFFLLGWIILVPIGSAITFDDIPNLQRTLILIPALSIISGFGFIQIEDFLRRISTLRKNKNLFILINLLFVIFFIYNVTYYLQQYYIHSPLHQPLYRQVGFKQLVKEVSNFSSSFSSVEITKAESNPGLFFLFYTEYDPSKLQSKLSSMNPKVLNSIGFGNISFGKYKFIQQDCPLREISSLDQQGRMTDIVNGKVDVLYVDGGACKIPKTHVKVLDIIRRPDNTPVFLLLKYSS